MNSILIGDPQAFAIEYSLQSLSPPFGRVRVWAGNEWFGDFRREMFLYYMADNLRAMRDRSPLRLRHLYAVAEDVPSDQELLHSLSWSWGDVFDDFLTIIYAVEAERMIHVLWALHPTRVSDFPGYSPGPHHARVPYLTFDGVVTQFVDALAIR
ncbi:MAG: hypothetical protein ACRC8S_09320 [Fimbriiglobus sp.]